MIACAVVAEIVAVENLFPFSFQRHTKPVIGARHGREVGCKENHVACGVSFGRFAAIGLPVQQPCTASGLAGQDKLTENLKSQKILFEFFLYSKKKKSKT